MGKYDDIIGLPRPELSPDKRMSARKRGAQFSSFAALSGFEDIITETARTTDCRPVPDQDRVCHINAVLQFIEDNISLRPEAAIVFFVPDSSKSGGTLFTASGNVRHIDHSCQSVIFDDNRSVAISDIYDIFAEGYSDEN